MSQENHACEPREDSANWSAFYDAVAHRPPHDTALRALALFDGGPERLRFAIDLGCGSGRDTREMLRRGWRVLAMDREAEAIQRLIKDTPAEHRARLQTQVAAFEDVCDLRACDFVNASFSLPFCAPAHFDVLWSAIVVAIQPRGRFAGTFFGERDGWVNEPAMTFHTRAQAEALLHDFKVEQFVEEDRDGQTALGNDKHWHTFQVVAFKR